MVVKEDSTPTEATIKLEKQLLKTTWITEAELIQKYVPEDDLSKNQKKLLQKCIDKEDFTDKQFSDLKLLLNKYRLFLQELNPEEKIKNVEETVQLIHTEQEFLDLLDQDNYTNLRVNLPYNGRLIEFEFEILPLEDSRIITALESHIDIFQDFDFDFDEAVTYSNASFKNPEDLTEEEQRIVEKLNKEVMARVSTERIKGINKFLSNQLRIKGSDCSVEVRQNFWNKFHFNAKFAVFTLAQERLGLNTIEHKKLFPSSK